MDITFGFLGCHWVPVRIMRVQVILWNYSGWLLCLYLDHWLLICASALLETYYPGCSWNAHCWTLASLKFHSITLLCLRWFQQKSKYHSLTCYFCDVKKKKKTRHCHHCHCHPTAIPSHPESIQKTLRRRSHHRCFPIWEGDIYKQNPPGSPAEQWHDLNPWNTDQHSTPYRWAQNQCKWQKLNG